MSTGETIAANPHVLNIIVCIGLFAWMGISAAQDRRKERKRYWDEVDEIHNDRVRELARVESLLEEFELQELKRLSACAAQHRCELTGVGHDHPEERTRLLAAHREELAGLDRSIKSRRAARLEELERSYGSCFRPHERRRLNIYSTRYRPKGKERRQLLEHEFAALRRDRAAQTAAYETRLEHLDVEHRLERARRVAEQQLELADIGHDQPGKRAAMLAAHTDELAVLDRDACVRRTEYRAVKEEWMKVRDRLDYIHVNWLADCFLPNVDAETRQWIDEQAAELRSGADVEHGSQGAAAVG